MTTPSPHIIVKAKLVDKRRKHRPSCHCSYVITKSKQNNEKICLVTFIGGCDITLNYMYRRNPLYIRRKYKISRGIPARLIDDIYCISHVHATP